MYWRKWRLLSRNDAMPHLGDYIPPKLRYSVQMKVGQTLKLAACMVLTGASSIAAADTVSVTAAPFGLGRVVSSGAVTAFTIDSAGVVTQSPATPTGAKRLTTGTVTVATLNFVCNPCTGNAAAKTMTVTVTATPPSGARAKFSSFTRATSATGANVASNTSGLPLVFTLAFTGSGSSQNASIGLTASIQVLTSGTKGALTLPFTVSTSR